jgi:radical SAM PhpK family P-methyltransferase
MKKTIDCLFIGQNEANFAEYERNIKKMGQCTGAYRDLNLNFIRYGSRPYPPSEIFNLFYCSQENPTQSLRPLKMGENLSAAVAYLGSYLNKRGYTFDYVKSFQDEKEELIEKLEQENILTIAIITTLYVAVLPILEIVDLIKKHNHTARIIIGGPFVAKQVKTLNPIETQFLFNSMGADFYVESHQGEATLVKIIHALKNRLPVEQINNIYFKDGKKYVKTPLLRENNKLSENMVNWDLFSDRVGQSTYVRTSISCPFSCSFCGFPENGGKYQTLDVANVEQELNRLTSIETVESIQFIDDTFNVPVKRFKEILRMMIKNKYKLRWHSYFRCQFADREMVELMKESGCRGVCLGIESGNDQILKNMNKMVSVEKYLRGIELLKEVGILVYSSFITGFPGETRETAADTIQFIKESGMDFYRPQLWYCDTVTPIWKEKEKYHITGSHFEWSHATMDAKTAGDIIDHMFLTIENPTWVPMYYFGFEGIFHLLDRGLSIRQVKEFLNSFNEGIKEKLIDPASQDVSPGVIRQLKESCRNKENVHVNLKEKESIMNEFDVGFDFNIKI